MDAEVCSVKITVVGSKTASREIGESTESDLPAVLPDSGREATPLRPTSFSFIVFKDCII